MVLKKNYRFGAESGIGEAGRAVNAGAGVEAFELLRGGSCAGIAWRDVPRPDALKKALAGAVVEGYAPYLDAGSPAGALAQFDAFRLLCALRQGPYGVAGINALAEQILAEKGLIDLQSRWYRGRPVIITANDYNLKLFNGDVGIVFPDSPPCAFRPMKRCTP